MQSKLKVVFMGTPDFAVHILDKIHQAGYPIVGVVSTPDKPAGRGQKMHSSAVTQYAKEHNLFLMQPPKLKAKSFVETLESLQADVFVVVAFRMLPKIIWNMPSKGTFNLHASLLPQYRGAAPINWAIINGEEKSGVTTFFLDEKTDTGNIIYQQEVDILPDETAGELHDKLMYAGGDLVLKTLEGISENAINPTPQNHSQALKDAPKLFKENTHINWSDSLENIYNFVRGLNPYPAAWTQISLNGETKLLKVFKIEIEKTNHSYQSGQLVEKNKRIGVAHHDGWVWLEEVQMQGKRRMNIVDFANGINLGEDSHILFS
ncbi:methionyl-tRNA formyltransferase [Ornithobacterium rhinotracheale]